MMNDEFCNQLIIKLLLSQIRFVGKKNPPERAIFFKMIFFAKKNHFKKNGSLYPPRAARPFPQTLFVGAVL
jgi:hypothetical protein